MTTLSRFMTRPAVIIGRVRSSRDAHGNWLYQEVTTPTRVYLAASSMNELAEGRASEEFWTAYLPAEAVTAMDAFSALEVEGVRYEVDGTPSPQRSLTNHTRVHHIEVTVTRSSS